MVAYADDFSAAGSILILKRWQDTFFELGPKFGYFSEPSKSWLIVKSGYSDKAVHIFQDTNINPFQANVPFLYPLKTFSGGIEREHWPEMG